MTQRLLRILGNSHAVEIMESIRSDPKRFVELRSVCSSNRTRAQRLKELKQERLITAIAKMCGEKAYTFYQITPKGKKVLELANSVIQLSKDQEKTQE